MLISRKLRGGVLTSPTIDINQNKNSTFFHSYTILWNHWLGFPAINHAIKLTSLTCDNCWNFIEIGFNCKLVCWIQLLWVPTSPGLRPSWQLAAPARRSPPQSAPLTFPLFSCQAGPVLPPSDAAAEGKRYGGAAATAAAAVMGGSESRHGRFAVAPGTNANFHLEQQHLGRYPHDRRVLAAMGGYSSSWHVHHLIYQLYCYQGNKWLKTSPFYGI